MLSKAAPFLMFAAAAVLARRQQGTAGEPRHGEEKTGRREASGGARATSGDVNDGRGRSADAPRQIPARGWKDILLRTKTEFSEDNVPMIAAGVTFYGVLALFPGLAAFISLYGLFADASDVHKHIQGLSGVIPGGAIRVVSDQMQALASAPNTGLSAGFVLGLLTALWSANGAVKALIIGLNIAYEEKETRGFVKRTAISLGFTLGFLVFGLLAIAALGAGPAIEAVAGHGAAVAAQLGTGVVVVLCLAAGLALLYRYGPSRDPVRLRWITWGSGIAVLVWLAMSLLFTTYVANFGHYNKTYGVLGAAVGFMTWLYLSAMVALAGAELNAEIEHQTAVDTTGGAPKPLGARNAKMADTLGAAQGR